MKKLTDENRLSILEQELVKEWSNKNELAPNQYSIYSGKKVWWKCKDENCRHEWKSTIDNGVGGNGCPKCSHGRISKQACSWLNCLNIPDDPNHREVFCEKLKTYFDGYEPSTNTVYEYHGDFWHGNPKRFNQNEINNVSKKSFGELYAATKKREQDIINAGYNLVVMWESD